jgi:Methyltransferase domain
MATDPIVANDGKEPSPLAETPPSQNVQEHHQPTKSASESLLKSCLSPASFWSPERVGPQPHWLEHAPFAFWLIEALRPRTIVELGTHGGFSYFVFCQAVQRLGLATRCWAVDTWKGDVHTGIYGEKIFQQVRDYHNSRFSYFSILVRSTFQEALSKFDDRTIDLLHVDGSHSYDDVKADYESWCPKLSERGVVIFHDIKVRHRDFGVYRLWDELSVLYPHFEFLHGHGLGVLGVGDTLPPSILTLFMASADETASRFIREAYGRLGTTISLQLTNELQCAQLKSRAAEAELR